MSEKHIADVSKKDTISRQAAIDEIDEWVEAFKQNGHKESAADALFIKVGIGALPSAQPEIIRCKDCIYYRQEIDMCDEPCSTAHNVVHEDDYCSRAKKENG